MKDVIYLNNHRVPGADATRARDLEVAALQTRLAALEAEYEEETYGAIFGTVNKESSRSWRHTKKEQINCVKERLYALNAPLSAPSSTHLDENDEWTEEVAGASWFAKVFQ